MSHRFETARIGATFLDILNFEGHTYEFSWVEAVVPVGAKRYIEVTTASDKITLYSARRIITDGARAFFNNYTAYTILSVDTPPIVPTVLRLDSQYPTGAVINRVTPNTIDLTSVGLPVPSFGSNAGGGTPGIPLGTDSVRVIPPGAKFLLELHNDSINPEYIQLDIRYSEVDLDYLLRVPE